MLNLDETDKSSAPLFTGGESAKTHQDVLLVCNSNEEMKGRWTRSADAATRTRA